MAAVQTREYTPRPLDHDTYSRFVDITLAYPGWCTRYSADESGDTYYQAVHYDTGDTVGSYDLDRFARLLATADGAVR
ncbi:hypothetical protein ACFPZ0_11215 [Streptomonospora nanhaiensis]|uniref:Uncharacterized protein n=1 Tax=Streptomonospora nanhaiensis TaxID=1323731 RepID=A0A853BSD8_9ACTN|nr:hypothetical protein [Streptomonospora nanhaiensis]MBV2365980.1 hypothetical protein [Streptomonospora nanhaiensis]MBX9388839.1 hypothetical protein [Streptomonospora nanhaiensis]NYI98298.1 hypothetical protein [Streptomonospora nanhaiensis]